MANDHYDQAAPRHFEDAEHLAALQRWDGAGHLIGFAAECAIKHSLEALRADTHGHLPTLIQRARLQLCGRTGGPWHAVLDAKFRTVWGKWTVNGRYHASGTTVAAGYEEWRDQARRALEAAGLRK